MISLSTSTDSDISLPVITGEMPRCFSATSKACDVEFVYRKSVNFRFWLWQVNSKNFFNNKETKKNGLWQRQVLCIRQWFSNIYRQYFLSFECRIKLLWSAWFIVKCIAE